MSKLKKVLLMCTAYVLVAALAIGGTIAYLQDDDSDVNVMTLGNVSIAQHEYEREVDANGDYVVDSTVGGYKLQPFTQDKPLYPATIPTNSAEWTYESTNAMFEQVGANGGGMTVFVEPNAVDKFVFVENTGKTDAYVRTLIAFESGSLSVEEWDEVVCTSYHFSWGDPVVIGSITVENNNYVVLEYTYKGRPDKGFHENGILPADEVTQCSLGQVYMRSTATNEDCEAIDGNKNGKYDILVLSQAVQTAGFADAKTALDTAFGKSSEKAAEWFNGVWAKHVPDLWDGSVDTTWYNDTDTEFTLTTAEQLAGFAKLVDGGNTFTSKTVKLGKNLDLYVEDANGEPISFEPIGSYRKDTAFKGTFDGQGYTIANLSQNTWALNNGYYYGDLGLGLFGKVEDATIKNLVMDGASISGESAMCGTVAAAAYGDCMFENITVKNSQVNDYQYYAGGIVGWASGNHTYKNINVDASTTIGGQWGDFGNANGGIIGGIGSSAVILFEDCTIACRIDAVNDVVSAYQWYNYRNSGMLIGRVPQTITNGEVQTVKTPENVTCKNVTVIYDDWANYTYCEFAGTGYPYVRVQAGVSVDAYSNVRYGHPTDANGNTVVDDNHVHNAGEAHHELIAFDQLFGGPAEHRYCYYGISEFEGVTVNYNNK